MNGWMALGVCLLSAACGDTASVDNCDGPDVYRTRIVANDLSMYDGATGYVVSQSQFCRATTSAAINGGSLEVLVESRTDVEVEVYPVIGLFIDVDADDGCTRGTDAVWSGLTTAIVGRDVIEMVRADDLGRDPYDVCASFAR